MLSPPAASAPGQGSFCYPERTPGQPPSLSPRNALGVAPSPSIAWRHEPRAGAAPGPVTPVPALPHAQPLLLGGGGAWVAASSGQTPWAAMACPAG